MSQGISFLAISTCLITWLASMCLDAAERSASTRPEVTTGVAESLGNTGLSVNGIIHPKGRPTVWFVEYGSTPALGMKTSTTELPPRLTAFYYESWDTNAGGWQGGMSGNDVAHHQKGGVSGGFLRFSEPSGNDPNHVDGIGTLHLCKYVYPGLLPGANGTTMLAAGDPDFRNARVSLKVRGTNWQPNGSELVWWTQSQSNIEKLFSPEWRRANWAYTGFSLTPYLSTGQWESVEYRLLNDSTRWTYGGNNLAQKRPNYEYWPIDNSQRHLNNDFFHLLTFIDPAQLPQGSIDFDELIVAYHNYSLLIPSNGGHLIRSPEGPDTPSQIMDGWRHGEKKVWRSAAHPSVPQEFVWKFDAPVEIEAIQVHQNSEFPSKTVEVFISTDSQTWTSLARLELSESSTHGPNYQYMIARPEPKEAGYMKVSILSGYQAEAWGLGEVEVFGTGATMLPEDEPTPVTVDLTGLSPGSTCYYRLVGLIDGQTCSGEICSMPIPSRTVPLISVLPASRISNKSARLEARLNPMGKPTQFWFEYGVDPSYGLRTSEMYGGLQITPRLAAMEIRGLMPGTKYHYRLIARNESGITRGPDMQFQTLDSN